MKPHFFVSILLVGLLFATYLQANGGVEAKRYKSKLKFCKIDMLFECLMEPLAYFTHQANGSGIANSDEEMEQFCFNLVDYFPVCAKQWLEKCGSPLHVELAMRMFILPFRESFKDFCNRDGEVRTEFLKYSTCLIHQVKLSPSYRKNCIRPLQAGQEFIFDRTKSSLNMTSTIRNVCCSYNQWENCIVHELTRNCGKASGQVFPNLIHHGSIMTLKGICPMTRYDPENPAHCNKAEFNAPADYVPRGLKSHSLASYIFSYSCPNVGWGIVESRDF